MALPIMAKATAVWLVDNTTLTFKQIADFCGLHELEVNGIADMYNAAADGEEKRRGPRYTPLSKRQDRPASILWLVKFHPELTDGQISKLVGTTKPTIQALRDRSHWNIANIQPIDPVALGLCKQLELDAAVQKAAKKAAKDGVSISDEERSKLVSTEQSLSMDAEPKIPSSIGGLENFTFGADSSEEEKEEPEINVDNVFKNIEE